MNATTNKPRFILISGKAQAGKDTSALLFSMKLNKSGTRAIIVHYADLLKYILKTYYGWDGNKDAHGRRLLQTVGTDIIRKQNSDYWVDFVTNLISMIGGSWDYIIVADVRFPNEIERVREAGFKSYHVRITREEGWENTLTSKQRKHPSETALDNYKYDYLIVNNTGDMESLEKSVEDICNAIEADKVSQEETDCVQMTIDDVQE